MYYKCCVRGCENTRKDAILHKFPKNENRLNIWLRALDIERSSAINQFVCQKHFEKKFIGPGSKLLSKAYPSLFTQSEISCGMPHKTENPLKLEHNYCHRAKHNDHNYFKEKSSSSGPTQSQTVLSATHQNNQDRNIIDKAKPSSFAVSNIETPSVNPGFSGNREILPPTVEVENNSTEAVTTTEDKVRVQTPTPTLKTAQRRRLVYKCQKLCPTAKKIYEEYVKAKNQANFHKRAKRALKFSTETSFKKLTNNLSPYAQKFLAMQIKLCKKKKQGHRFTLEEKLIALSIMKEGQKCYRFLQRIFILPSVSTLNKMASKLNIEAGNP